VAGVALLAVPGGVSGQRPKPLRAVEREGPRFRDGDAVAVDYPDAVSLAAFVDYVSQSLEVRIIYGDELRAQSVVVRPSRIDVPKSELLNMLRGMLRMQDLALVEGDMDGWLRVVRTDDLHRHVRDIRSDVEGGAAGPSNRVVTQVVAVASDDLGGVAKYARMFLSSSRASVVEVEEQRLLIITDYESAIARALEIVELIDVPACSARVVSVPVRHMQAQQAVTSVASILTEKARLEGRSAPQLVIQPHAVTNSVLLIGAEEDVAEARALVERLEDEAGGYDLAVPYRPKHVSVGHLRSLIEQLIVVDSADPKRVKIFADDITNRLFVTAPADVHQRIRALQESEDLPSAEPARAMRVYQPKHRRAQELMSILSSVLPGATAAAVERGAAVRGVARAGQPGDGLRRADAGDERTEERGAAGGPAPLHRLAGTDFSLSVDDHTNSLIAVGPPAFHQRLEALLVQLDRRQAQVLIEMTLVAITFNDSLSLAVELASADSHGDKLSLFFSSFGLSGVDLATGMRTLNPGGGVNGVITGPDETPFLMRAIAAHGNSRIITTPKIVVSDRTTATIGSVEEAPFTSINASETVATTSFAGFESAGTTLTVTPQLAQGNHLSLDYSFTFSNFTGSGSVGVPPPRTTNSFNGTVEVPDGHTVIVGGLVTENEADSVTEVPLLGRIPVVGALFQSSARARTKSRIYAFIKPTILRDDQFADLKMISAQERDRASVADRDFPENEYLWMR
jgi:type II secretory pathway component GspD/PulD (secretin)